MVMVQRLICVQASEHVTLSSERWKRCAENGKCVAYLMSINCMSYPVNLPYSDVLNKI